MVREKLLQRGVRDLLTRGVGLENVIVGPDPVWVREGPLDQVRRSESTQIGAIGFRERDQKRFLVVETPGKREGGSFVNFKVMEGDFLEHRGFISEVGFEKGFLFDFQED